MINRRLAASILIRLNLKFNFKTVNFAWTAKISNRSTWSSAPGWPTSKSLLATLFMILGGVFDASFTVYQQVIYSNWQPFGQTGELEFGIVSDIWRGFDRDQVSWRLGLRWEVCLKSNSVDKISLLFEILSKGCPKLEFIDISWCTNLTSNSIKTLAESCSELKYFLSRGLVGVSVSKCIHFLAAMF